MINDTQWMVSIKEFGITDALSWPVHPDYSDYLPEDSTVLMEKPGLDIENGFNDLCSMATSLSQVFAFEDPYSEIYNTYGLKESEEEVIFMKTLKNPLFWILAMKNPLFWILPILLWILPVLFWRSLVQPESING